ncbi:MAG: hypothetical protein LBP60_02960 [Spirochaetaceae bacterium]|jgi:hypothetical protein|nr:hypothetical protein [Spirochaetaceae bacterium]
MKYIFSVNHIVRTGFFVLFFFILCAAGSTQDETWQIVNSGGDLLGSWEGTDTLSIPKDENAFIPASFLKVVVRLVCTKDNVTVLIRVDFDQFLKDLLALPQVRDTGISKEVFWESVTSQFLEMRPELSFQGYSIEYQQSEAVEAFLNDNTLKINGRRNRLKIIFTAPLTLGLGDAGLEEIVLVKKR